MILRFLSFITISVIVQGCTAVPAPEPYVPRTQSNEASNYSVGTIKQKREREYANKLAALQKRNPVRDAHNLASERNIYLWVYQSGRGGKTKASGLTAQQLANANCRLRQMDGMGDAIYGDNHLKYRIANRRYASQFNKVMLRYCK